MGCLLTAGAFGKAIGDREKPFFGVSGGPAVENGLRVEYGDLGCNGDLP